MSEIPKFQGDILDIGNDYFLVKKSVVFDWVEQMENLKKDVQEMNVKKAEKKTGTVEGKEGRKPSLTDEQKEQVLELRKRGYSLRQIAEVFGVSHETIRQAENEQKNIFREVLGLEEQDEILKMYEQGKSIKEIQAYISNGQKVDQRAIRGVIGERFGTRQRCERCNKNTMLHIAETKGGKEFCNECGTYAVTKISADPLQGGSNIFGTKGISEDFRKKD